MCVCVCVPGRTESKMHCLAAVEVACHLVKGMFGGSVRESGGEIVMRVEVRQ